MVNMGSLGAGIAGGATVAIVIKAIDEYSGVFNNVNKGMLALGAGITAIGIAGAGAVIGLTKIAGQFEQTQTAFTTMLGSAEEANDLLKELADFAAKTPFNIPSVELAAKQLVAYGFEVDGLIGNMRMLGDVAGAFTVPMQDMSYLYGTLKAQGRAYTRDMNQFANRGIPIWREMAKVMNVAESEVRELVESGKVGFPEVEQAFINMTSEGGIAFEGMDKQSKTFLGVVSNIQDSFIKLARVMGIIFLPAAKWVAEHLAVIMAWFEEHPTIAKWAAIILAVGTALALIIGPLLILVALLPALIAGFGALSAATLPIAGTVLAIAAAIAILITGIYYLFKVWDDLGTKTKILLALMLPMIAIPVLLIKEWDKVKNFFILLGNVYLMVWNGILSAIENNVNTIISVVNFLIRQLNRIPGFDMGRIGNLDLGSMKKNLMEYDFGDTGSSNDKGGDTIVNIESIYGVDSDDISESLAKSLGHSIKR